MIKSQNVKRKYVQNKYIEFTNLFYINIIMFMCVYIKHMYGYKSVAK